MSRFAAKIVDDLKVLLNKSNVTDGETLRKIATVIMHGNLTTEIQRQTVASLEELRDCASETDTMAENLRKEFDELKTNYMNYLEELEVELELYMGSFKYDKQFARCGPLTPN